jgi:hypothetical protein
MTTEGPTPPDDASEPSPGPDRTEQPATPPDPGRSTPASGEPPPITPPILGEPSKTGMSGCAKAAIIGGAIILVLGIGIVAVVVFGFMRFADDVEDSFGESPCQFISSEEASDVIGTEVEATSGDSALGAILDLIRDTRLLADSPSCFISDADSTIQIWIAVHDGGDAATVFAEGAAVADGQVVSEQTTDSGSVTVETEAFRGEDVPGLGEEAFCVELGAVVSGGVFARSEDRVVYVSALAMAGNEGAEVFDDSLCQRAIPIAEALIG